MELITNSQENRTGNLYVPPASFTPTYDLDGNLTDDGEWTYLWDAENRMKAATRAARAVTAGAPYRRYEHTYDAMSRLVQTKTFATAGTTVLKTEQYIYNGWNRVAMLESAGTATPALRQSYAWGLDISAQNGNSGQDSGSIGALLVVTDTQLGNHCPCYDSNGNIIAMVNAATKAISAQYGYSPFGETTRATGPFAEANPYRFSTKPTDSDTGLIYYGYRFYKPKWQTWPSRDPIEERGGVNLYGFVQNDGVNRWDYLGQISLNYTAAPNSSVTPFELGIEWLTGLGPRHRDFKDGDAFAEQIRSHNHIQTKIKEVTDAVTGKCNNDCKYTGPYSPPKSTSSYNLGGVEGVAKYLGDYSNLLTFGAFGNLAVTFTGSYGATFTVSNIDCCKNTADLEIVTNNRSHAASALRPPVLGYTDWWQTHVAPVVNQLFQSGPGSPTTQKVTLTEKLTLSSTCK